MKANQYGTTTEQNMFYMGYQTLTQRAGCKNCIYVKDDLVMPDTQYEYQKYRCEKGDFATTKSAICNDYGVKS